MLPPLNFASLFDTYYPRLYAYIRSRVTDRDTAEDITAQAFERAFSHAYDPARASFATWLFHIGRNLVINYQVTASRRPAPYDLDEVAEVETVELTPEQQLLHQEQRQQLLAAIATLPERDREIIQMKFFGRLTNRHIAEVMELKEKTVSVIVLRSLQKLKVHLERQQIP